VTSSLRKSQENSIIKTDHGDSIRDSDLQTHQTPTDTIVDRKGISKSIHHAPVYAIIDKLMTNQGSKVKRSVGGHVTMRGTWCMFHGPCRRQKTAIWPIDHQCVPQRPHPAEIPCIDETVSSVVHHLDGSVGGNSKNSCSKFDEVMTRWVNELSTSLNSSCQHGIRMCVTPHRSSLAHRSIGDAYKNTFCVNTSYLDLPHRGKTVVVGPNAGSAWGG
jgi:hypothetical protein